MTPRILRALAFAIAVAAVLDPALTRTVTRRAPLEIVALDAGSMTAAARLRDWLDDSADGYVRLHDSTSSASACAAGENCVIVSAGVVPARVAGNVIGVFKHTPENTPLFRNVAAPLRAHRDAASTLRVEVQRPVDRVEIFDGTTLVGAADAGDDLAIDVPWVPLAAGARALRVEAAGQRTHVGVLVEDTPARLLFYEPQATWLGTFVRRALADDPRFEVQGRTRVAPPVSITRGPETSLTASALDRVGVAVVSAPERLTPAEVNLLEAFVTDRGGSLVVLLDQRPAGAALRLLPAVAAERREPDPQSIGLLRASEWLTFAPGVGVNVLAAAHDQPVIVSRLIGQGRVIVSGALDAWRYRHASEAFDTFWTTLAWDAASLAAPPLRVQSNRVAARSGEEVQIFAEARMLHNLPELRARAEAHVRCGTERQFLRLWPGPRPGTFRGTVRVARPAECVVTARVNDVSATTPVTFDDELTAVVQEEEGLEAFAAAFNAVLASDESDEQLRDAVRTRVARSEQVIDLRPMRSPWWLLLFATCLGMEWWLRRRSGVS